MKSTLMKTTLAMLALSTLLTATGAQADWNRESHTYRQGEHAYRQSQRYGEQINARQERQMDRIRAGLHDGSLNRREFRDLMYEQRTIEAMESHFRADGVIDAREFRQLDRALATASDDIRTERHDRQARFAYNAARWSN
jgi:uncharacterized membrane protein YebE (DUF533 family)